MTWAFMPFCFCCITSFQGCRMLKTTGSQLMVDLKSVSVTIYVFVTLSVVNKLLNFFPHNFPVSTLFCSSSTLLILRSLPPMKHFLRFVYYIRSAIYAFFMTASAYT